MTTARAVNSRRSASLATRIPNRAHTGYRGDPDAADCVRDASFKLLTVGASGRSSILRNSERTPIRGDRNAEFAQSYIPSLIRLAVR